MRSSVFSYLRLVVASWLFVGGLAVQFETQAEAQREARARERAWRELRLSPEQREAQDVTQDAQDRWVEWQLRLAGVVLGGIGFAIALHEAAYVASRYARAVAEPSAAADRGRM